MPLVGEVTANFYGYKVPRGQHDDFSESLVAPGIEPGPLDLQPGTMTTRPQRQISWYIDVPKICSRGTRAPEEGSGCSDSQKGLQLSVSL
jgi:hypothetical protein